MSGPSREVAGGASIEDRILDLVQGFLTEDEARELLSEIRGDARAEQWLLSSARGWERARAQGPPHPHVVPQEIGARIRGWLGMRRTWAWGFGLAAALLAVVLLLPDRSTPSYVALPGNWEELHLRSEGRLSPELREGLVAYSDGDWRRAIGLLRDAPADGATDLLRRVYLASALAFSNRPADALVELEDVPLDRLPQPWGGEARWTRAIALRDLGRTSEARDALLEIADEPGALGERARQILSR